MSTPKPGDLVAIKTTGEIAFVLDTVETREEDFTNLGIKLALRVPVAGQGGIHHTIQSFFEAEVESPTEHIEREFSEIKSRQKVMRDDLGAAPGVLGAVPTSN